MWPKSTILPCDPIGEGALQHFAGWHAPFVAGPDGALLNYTDNVCRGFAVLRYEVPLWTPE